MLWALTSRTALTHGLINTELDASIAFDPAALNLIVPGVYRWDLYLRLFLVFFAGSSLLPAWLGRLWQRLEVGDVA